MRTAAEKPFKVILIRFMGNTVSQVFGELISNLLLPEEKRMSKFTRSLSRYFPARRIKVECRVLRTPRKCSGGGGKEPRVRALRGLLIEPLFLHALQEPGLTFRGVRIAWHRVATQ